MQLSILVFLRQSMGKLPLAILRLKESRTITYLSLSLILKEGPSGPNREEIFPETLLSIQKGMAT